MRYFRYEEMKISKYFRASVWIDYFSRKLRFYIKKIICLNEKIYIHPDSNISLFSSLGSQGGVIRLKEYCVVDTGVILRAYGGYIEIGERCTIGPYSVLYGGGSLIIGNCVRIAPQVMIVAANHVFMECEQLIIEQGMSTKGIRIDDDVWIGAGAKILDGVVVGKGTVVGAGAVVTKSTEPYSIVVGVPARTVGSRRTSSATQVAAVL